MSFRYRLVPTPEQEAVLREHCAHARFVWNLGQEQRLEYRPGRGRTPGFVEQCRQLTEARAAESWLASGSQNVQQQALRDLDEAWENFFAGIQRRPGWRKSGRHEGFRITDFDFARHIQRLNRNWGRVKIPKIGWVRFRWSRAVLECKSYRVTRDRSECWHVAFAAVPEPIPAPGNGEVVGIDRGVAISAALSTGEMLTVARLSPARSRRLVRLQRKLARSKRGSNRHAKVRRAMAQLRARDAVARKDWAEKVSTDIAQRFDVIRVEDLNIRNMTRSAKGTAEIPGKNVRQKAGLNRGILRSGWGLLVKRLEQKALGRVEKIEAAYTSQRCSACGHMDEESRESQADFVCTACGFTLNADVNAAINIAAGHAVTARGGFRAAGPANREPLVGAT